MVKDKDLVKKEDVRFDIGEILNDINDDLGVEEDEAHEVYKTINLNNARIKAIRKYTLKIIKKKYKKYGGKD